MNIRWERESYRDRRSGWIGECWFVDKECNKQTKWSVSPLRTLAQIVLHADLTSNCPYLKEQSAKASLTPSAVSCPLRIVNSSTFFSAHTSNKLTIRLDLTFRLLLHTFGFYHSPSKHCFNWPAQVLWPPKLINSLSFHTWSILSITDSLYFLSVIIDNRWFSIFLQLNHER